KNSLISQLFTAISYRFGLLFSQRHVSFNKTFASSRQATDLISCPILRANFALWEEREAFSTEWRSTLTSLFSGVLF
ncbi:hypothetical protein, partial [Pantoea agglomerans]|uniref:hypothetical protein n=1 Tax=Enterobacter agglomerans TaxID=549 RepID=UPI001A8E718B